MRNYIDMHCDTLSAALHMGKQTITHMDKTMVDVERLLRSGTAAQFFAMFLTQKAGREWYGLPADADLTEVMMSMYQIFRNTLAENADTMAFAGCYEDLKRNERDGKLSAFLTIENGYPVKGDMDNLKKYHDLGVRLITLTWNDPNCFGQNHSTDPVLMNTGLTSFGKEAIEVMNDLGIAIDVSHLSDGGFWDVARLTAKPFVASHSNCRALSGHTRNLTDDMIRAVAEKGGVCGLNFESSFLNADLTDRKSRIDRMCDHVEHYIKVGGVEIVGIGSDFDGIGGDLEIGQCTDMYRLFDALERRGISDDVIDRIAYGNVARVIRESMW